VRENLFYQRSEKNRGHLTGDETFFHIADEIRACVINRHLGGIFGLSYESYRSWRSIAV